MSDEEHEISARITKVWNETLRLQKALQDVDLKISKKNEKVGEYEITSSYISNSNPRLFEKVGRLYIETTSENYRRKYETNVIENDQLERTRELLTGNFRRSESLLREESKEDPMYCLKRALIKHGNQAGYLIHQPLQWLVYNVPTGSESLLRIPLYSPFVLKNFSYSCSNSQEMLIY